MRGFEQAVSSRYRIMQFHRPVKLKLIRKCSQGLPYVHAEYTEFFLFYEERTVFVLDSCHRQKQVKKTMITDNSRGRYCGSHYHCAV